jgi:hypothetical protein
MRNEQTKDMLGPYGGLTRLHRGVGQQEARKNKRQLVVPSLGWCDTEVPSGWLLQLRRLYIDLYCGDTGIRQRLRAESSNRNALTLSTNRSTVLVSYGSQRQGNREKHPLDNDAYQDRVFATRQVEEGGWINVRTSYELTKRVLTKDKE